MQILPFRGTKTTGTLISGTLPFEVNCEYTCILKLFRANVLSRIQQQQQGILLCKLWINSVDFIVSLFPIICWFAQSIHYIIYFQLYYTYRTFRIFSRLWCGGGASGGGVVVVDNSRSLVARIIVEFAFALDNKPLFCTSPLVALFKRSRALEAVKIFITLGVFRDSTPKIATHSMGMSSIALSRFYSFARSSYTRYL